MRITKEQQKRFKLVPDEQKESTLVSIYKQHDVTMRNLATLSGFEFSTIVEMLKRADVKRCNNPECEQPLKSWSDFAEKTLRCKVCMDKYMKKYNKDTYAQNRDEMLANNKIYREENPDKVQARQKRYREENKEKLQDSRRLRYINNPEKKKASSQKHYSENKYMYLAWSSKRRAAKRKCTVPYADDVKINEIYKECRRITEETGISHEVDHIYPIQGELVCGFHVEYNLQILPASENRSKYNKILM